MENVLNVCRLKGGNGRKNVFGHENRKIFLKISSNSRETDMTTP